MPSGAARSLRGGAPARGKGRDTRAPGLPARPLCTAARAVGVFRAATAAAGLPIAPPWRSTRAALVANGGGRGCRHAGPARAKRAILPVVVGRAGRVACSTGDAAQSAQRERGGRAPPGATSAAGSFGACLAWRAMAGSKTSGPMCGPGRLRRAGPHRADAVRRVQPAPRSVTVPATPTHGPPAAPMIGRNPERSPLAEARRAFKPVPGGRGRGGTRFPKGGRLSGGPKPTMCALCHRRAQSAPHPVLRFRVRRARPARPNKRRYRPSATACCARQSRHRCRPCSPRPACSRPGSPGQPPRRGR